MRRTLVVAAALVATVGLSACGGGKSGGGTSDQQKITQVVSAINANPKNFCSATYVTGKFIADQVQPPGCPWDKQHPWKTTIQSITIHGSTASLKVLDALGPPDPGNPPDAGELTLVKQGGTWKVDSGGASNAIG